MPQIVPRILIRIANRYLRLSQPVLEVLLILLLLPLVPLKLIKFRRSRGRLWCYHWCGCGPVPEQPSLLEDALAAEDKVRCVAISDTHMCHASITLPEADVLIHAGDCTNFGRADEVDAFLNWFGRQPHPHKILVPGNHDMIFDEPYWARRWSDWSNEPGSVSTLRNKARQLGVVILEDQSVTISGVRFFGSPWTIDDMPWVMGFASSPDSIAEKWAGIPEGTDVLITHQPPFGRGDREMPGTHTGCPFLAHRVKELRPKFHVFGHVHVDYGVDEGDEEEGEDDDELHPRPELRAADSQTLLGQDTRFVNVASVHAWYGTSGRPPVLFDVPRRPAHGPTHAV